MATPHRRSRSESDPDTPRESAGEGIGLSIVKRLCELLDASLELETAPGEGTTFRVIFPREYLRAPVRPADPRPQNESAADC